jgi:hypothetical protein
MPAPAYLRKIRPIQLIAIVFFTVSGGPYGLEPLLTYAGEHGALLVLLVTPLLWDVPAMFTVLELNAMMPITGGYYKWVKYALGAKWGFYEGWWTWLYTFVDLAIYPVLFVQYASFFFPGLDVYKIPICLVIIWGIRRVKYIGDSSGWPGVAVFKCGSFDTVSCFVRSGVLSSYRRFCRCIAILAWHTVPIIRHGAVYGNVELFGLG